MAGVRQRPALSVVGGGLGAGKTSLIARLLEQPGMGRTGVVVNEFGEFGVDDLMLGSSAPDAQLALLRNGCICCRPGNDLSEAVRKMIAAAPEPLVRILVETSGVAELSAVLAKIGADHVLRGMVRLDAAIAVVDATAPDETRAEHIACADRIVVTKTDLVVPIAAAAIRRRIAAMNPTVPILDGQARPDPDVLFNAGLIDGRSGEVQADAWLRAQGSVHVHHHGEYPDSIRSWLIETGPQDWTQLSQHIARMSRAAGPALLRLKGIVADRDDARPLALQMVRYQIYRPVRLTREAGDGRSRIVVIARATAAPAVEALAKRLSAAEVAIEVP
ncbi:GTP-binding protein [Sulfitobacter sp. G21635-S1]|uniref:CobW family GTP-binding protein n=1 Tax=Sulfitobacter sp. G21635-S1 TaxID=3014043 RepID=UPI0022AE6928|nr:GTP-binding protein [Sulfitobacter sp. G21635-S1]MCZ4254206.1 GTP-binding protein [Sulfitobacter sp. G21635-S1]